MVKKRRRGHPQSPGRRCPDHHHLLWQRKEWDAGSLKELREYPYCVMKMDVDGLHKKIHIDMDKIPPPSQTSAENALWQLQFLEKNGGITLNDPIERRLRVLISLFDCSEQPTADALKKQLKIVYEFKKAPN